MHLEEADLIAVYDAGDGARPARQAAALLEALRPGEDVSFMELGDRDRLLWAFKRTQFGRGTQMMAKVQCSGCGEWAALHLGDGFELPQKVSEDVSVLFDGKDWALRLPRQGDLGRQGFSPSVLNTKAPWDDPAFARVAEAAIDAADPAIDVVFDVTCAECGSVTESALDVVGMVWADVEAAAQRAFSDVALLAQNFGWTEEQTLALSPRRRARYLEMLA